MKRNLFVWLGLLSLILIAACEPAVSSLAGKHCDGPCLPDKLPGVEPGPKKESGETGKKDGGASKGEGGTTGPHHVLDGGDGKEKKPDITPTPPSPPLLITMIKDLQAELALMWENRNLKPMEVEKTKLGTYLAGFGACVEALDLVNDYSMVDKVNRAIFAYQLDHMKPGEKHFVQVVRDGNDISIVRLPDLNAPVVGDGKAKWYRTTIISPKSLLPPPPNFVPDPKWPNNAGTILRVGYEMNAIIESHKKRQIEQQAAKEAAEAEARRKKAKSESPCRPISDCM